MLTRLSNLYVSNEFLTNFESVFGADPPEWWTDTIDYLDIYLLNRAGSIGVNDNIFMFVPAWLGGKNGELQHIYDTLKPLYNTLGEDMDYTDSYSAEYDEHTVTRTITPVTDGVTTRTVKQDVTTENFNHVNVNGTYINNESESYGTTYETTTPDSRLTDSVKQVGGTTQHTTADALANEEKTTHTKEGYTDATLYPKHEDENSTKHMGHKKSPADIIRNEIDMRYMYSFMDVFVNMFIHDLTSGLYLSEEW